MVLAIVSLIVIGYLPGALIYRLPVADRSQRAALPADERAFWGVVISTMITTLVALALAAAEAYTFRRVVTIDAALAVTVLVAAGRRLRYAPAPSRPSWTAVPPLVLVGLGLYAFFPSSEYVMGGKDPGTYMNEGIQIAQHGSITIHDATLATVPKEFQGMFLLGGTSKAEANLHQGVRFMGFFVADRSRGEVLGQFPHAFPAWIAIGYGLDGLSGARRAVGVWAMLGLLAVYFVGARLAGRAPAFIAAVLLGINVAQVWYARYPNSEVMQQALLFAAFLALARAYRDDDRFFAPVAAALLGTLMFVRLDTLIILAGISAGLLLLVAEGQRIGWSFLAPLAALLAVSAAYFTRFLRPYLATPLQQLGGGRGVALAVVLIVVAGAAIRAVRRRWPAQTDAVLRWVPRLLSAGLAVAAFYAYFLRRPVGLLAEHDAYALRAFAWYVGPVGLLAAVAGFIAVAWTQFRRDPVLLTAGAFVSTVFFYKIRIVPENFWQARRYLAVILPLACVMMAGGAFVAYRARVRREPPPATAWSRARAGLLYLSAPCALLVFVGWTFAGATRPIFRHVEYAGMIPALERLAGHFGDRDLVLVEPSYSSDAHVLATPLEYIYARHVLVFSRAEPNREQFERFLFWATVAYDRVLLVADGGLRIASPKVSVTPLRIERFSVPEYESARNAYPREIRLKPFDLYLYRLQPSDHELPPIEIDVGGYDNAWVFQMFTRQVQDDVTYRWLRRRCQVSLPIQESTRAIILRASDGGRPARAGSADVQVFLNDRPLGTITVKGGFKDYRIAVPPDIAADAAHGAASAVVRFVCTTWVPKIVLGGNDDRALGIMLDRIRVE